ncbi:hypothetical protein ABZ721_14275 [Streptomyces sp. NPDC006733]|uniref:hypothetical protein n=1 Tax=Streptomyces sp. NPDC006733 TaxID=3155460 RepID=UPI0033E551FA
MTDQQIADVLWAWFGKENRSLSDYGVLANSGGRDKRQLFEDYIRDASPGNPPPEEHKGADGLPWVSIRGWTQETSQWIGVSIMEMSDLRDHSGRAVVPTRYFLLRQERPALYTYPYCSLYQAVQNIALPPDSPDSTLHVPLMSAGPQASCSIGLSHIGSVVRVHSEETHQRQIAAAHWAAAVAAELLAHEHVIIQQAGHLGRQDRLSVLDAVVAFLPYGLRSDLTVSTCLDSLRTPVARLAFCAQNPPGTRPITLGELPQHSAGPAHEYRARLHWLIDKLGPFAIVEHLWEQRTTLGFSDHRAIQASLGELDVHHGTTHTVPEQRSTAPGLLEALVGLRRSGPVSAEQQEVVRAALRQEDRDLGEELRRQWSHPLQTETMTRLVAERVLADDDGDAFRTGERSRALWQLAVASGRTVELLTELTRSPDLNGRHSGHWPAVDRVRSLGPAAVFAAGTRVIRTFRKVRPFTLTLLSAEADDRATLEAWLTSLRLTSMNSPAWLRAWGPLIPSLESGRVILPPDDAGVAVLVLDAAVRMGPPSKATETIRRLWAALVRTAIQEAATTGSSGSAQDPLWDVYDQVAHRPGAGLRPATSLLDPAAPALAEILDRRGHWDECRGLSDALRAVVGRPLLGPVWDAQGQAEYRDTVKFLGGHLALAHHCDAIVHAMAEVILHTMQGRDRPDDLLDAFHPYPAVAERIRGFEEAARPSPVLTHDGPQQPDGVTVLPAPPEHQPLPAALPETDEALERLEGIAADITQPLAAVVDAWAPLVFTPYEEQAAITVGWWWNRIPEYRRQPILQELERALTVRTGCSPAAAGAYVRRLALRIAGGELTSIWETNPGWEADRFLTGEKHAHKRSARRLRQLRMARLRSVLRLAHQAAQAKQPKQSAQPKQPPAEKKPSRRSRKKGGKG